MPRFPVLPALVALTGALITTAPAHAGSLSPDLASLIRSRPTSGQMVPVIVRYKSVPRDQRSLPKRFRGLWRGSLNIVGSAAISVPTSGLRGLAASPEVDHVSLDATVEAHAVPTTTRDVDVVSSGGDQAWSGGYTGRGVRIAFLDTGVNPGREFGLRRIAAWHDMVNRRALPYDDNGHGTHVAGIAVADGSNSSGDIVGMAPGAQIVCVKVLDATGNSSVSRVIAGIEWVVANRRLLNIRVLNLSLGRPPTESYVTDPLCRALRVAQAAGMVVVCSAGNYGKNAAGVVKYGGIASPGHDPAVITVGALNTNGTPSRLDDQVASYSGRGPTIYDGVTKPDLIAPGNRILAPRSPGSYLDVTYPENRYDWSPSTPWSVNYYRLSGTSMAAPQVAATVAILLQARPTLTPNAVKAVLMYTAERLLISGQDGAPLAEGLSTLTQGAGSLNTIGALKLALQINTDAAIGTRWIDEALQPTSTIAGQTVAWGGTILQGHQVLWGEPVIGIHQVLWGTDVAWDTLTPSWTQQVLWGGDGVAAVEPIWADPLLNMAQDPVFAGDPLALKLVYVNATIIGDNGGAEDPTGDGDAD